MKSRSIIVSFCLFCLFLIPENLFAQSELWGITNAGGANGKGALFKTNNDGSGFLLIKDFDASMVNPVGGLILASNGKLYGATSYGGTNDAGTVFEFDPVTSTLTKKLDISSIGGLRPSGGLLQATNGKLYGLAEGSIAVTPKNYGVLYEYDPATGTGVNRFTFQTLISGNPSGTSPRSALVQTSNGKLYGITYSGGQTVQGSLFEFDIATSTYTQKYSFGGPNSYPPQLPSGDLIIASNGKIYGTARFAGSSGTDEGVLFSYTPGATGISQVYSFQNTATSSGRYPITGVIQASNGKLYGTALSGGVNDKGTLFEYDLNTTSFSKKIDFESVTSGASPGRLTESANGKLYGMTTSGGANNKGTLFEFDPATGILTKTFDFSGTDGEAPNNSLLSVITSKQSQSITFDVLPSKHVGDAAFSLSATASSGLPVFFSSSDPTIVSISGTAATVIKEGTVTITASQVGNSGYNAATSVDQPLVILRTNQAITFNPLTDATFGGASILLTGTSSAGLAVVYSVADPTVATISNNRIVIQKAGSTVITASQPGNTVYYAAVNVDQSITINKASQTIQFTALSDKNINDASFNISATATSGIAVSFSSTSDKISLLNNQVTIWKAGRTTITASQAGNANYQAATPVDRSFCIKPARPELTLSSTSGTAILTSNALVGNQWYLNGALMSGQTNQTLALTETGIYKVKVVIDDCESEFSSETAFTLPKSQQTIQFQSITDKKLNDGPFNVSASATSGGVVSFSTTSDKINLSGAQVTILKAGRASITATQGGNATYFSATPVSQSFCIKPSTPEISTAVANGLTILTSNVVNGNQWYFNNTAISGQTAQTLLITQGGIYKVKVMIDDCEGDFSSEINAVITAIENSLKVNTISLFPNPALDLVTLSFNDASEKKSVSVYQADGKIKLSKEFGNSEGEFSVADYLPGVYFVKVVSKNTTTILKFIKR